MAGLLMLGEITTIREHYRHFNLSYLEEDESVAPWERWSDRIHIDGTWNANLFEFYLRVIRKLHERLRVPFALDTNMFRIDETPVHEALREALINTIVHADYSGLSGLKVVRRPDGFEMRNPGNLLVPAAQVWRGGVSEPRNPSLLGLFRHLRLGEREGSGGPKIVHAWRAQHWRAPSLVDELELGLTRLVLSNESLLAPKAVAALSARWGARFDALDEAGRIATVTLFVEHQATHARLVEAIGQHPRDVTLLLQRLMRQGLVERISGDRHSPYRLAAGGERAHKPGEAAHTLDSRAHKPEHGAHKPEHGAHRPQASAHQPDSDASAPAPTQWESQPDVAHIRRTRRALPALVDAAILAACADAPRTADELALALGRSKRTLTNHYLNRLVAVGVLVEQPTERGQPGYLAPAHDPNADRDPSTGEAQPTPTDAG